MIFYIRQKSRFMVRFNNLSSFSQIILLFIVTLTTWLLLSIAATFIGSLIWGTDIINNTQQILSNPGFARYFQIIQSLALFVLPPIFFALISQNEPFLWLRLKNPGYKYVVLAILIILIAQPFVSFLGYLNYHIPFPQYLQHIEKWLIMKEQQALELTKVFLDTSGWILMVLNIFIIAIIPAIGEELLFRGALQKLITALTKNHHVSVLITAFLFSAMHMQFFGFFPRFFLGIIFGYLVVYGKSIWLSITAHFINNFLAFILYNLSQSKNEIPGNPLEAQTELPNIFLVLLSILGVGAILFYLRKKQHSIPD